MFKKPSLHNLKVILLSFMVFNCDEAIPDNLLDPSNENYSEVSTVITAGPSEGSIRILSSATFSYTGGPLVIGYSHRIDFKSEVSDWSDWSTDTVVTYDNLDEGEQTFHVRGKYSETDIQLVSTQRNFIIDAVPGPSIRVFPRMTHADIYSEFVIDIYAEELEENTPISGVELEVQYDSQFIILPPGAEDPISKGELLLNHSGINLLIDEISEGSIKLNIGVSEGTNFTGLTGTGILCSITFQSIQSGQSSILINSPEYRDANNTIIEIYETISGAVIVGE